MNRNILALLNEFNLPEGNITESNYNEVLHALNSTSPSIIQELDLRTCDIQTFLSQVRGKVLKKNFWLKVMER